MRPLSEFEGPERAGNEAPIAKTAAYERYCAIGFSPSGIGSVCKTAYRQLEAVREASDGKTRGLWVPESYSDNRGYPLVGAQPTRVGTSYGMLMDV